MTKAQILLLLRCFYFHPLRYRWITFCFFAENNYLNIWKVKGSDEALLLKVYYCFWRVNLLNDSSDHIPLIFLDDFVFAHFVIQKTICFFLLFFTPYPNLCHPCILLCIFVVVEMLCWHLLSPQFCQSFSQQSDCNIFVVIHYMSNLYLIHFLFNCKV